MKKIIALILAAVMVLALAACGEESSSESSSSASASSETSESTSPSNSEESGTSESNDFTLFLDLDDGTMHSGHCREEDEQLVDVEVGETVEIDGFRVDGNDLILTGLEFETSAEIALVVPDDTRIVLDSGISILSVVPDGPDANTAVLYTKGNMEITGGDGTLICNSQTSEETTLWSRGICCRYGNLVISGGNIQANCGPCSRNAGAIYAGGRLYAEEYGEQENGAITITGGTVTGSSTSQVIRATETELTIGPHSVVINAEEFSGSEEEWHGDCLTQANSEEDLQVSFLE